MDKKEWRFDLAVPDKPGPRSYKFSFKVHVEIKTETVYTTTSSFDEKKDPTISKVRIAIRDESSMVLPNQKFAISAVNFDYNLDAKTDDDGYFYAKLKKGDRYNLETTIEGYKFTTYFEITKEVDEMFFNFDIDFKMVANAIVDSTYRFDGTAGTEPVKTIVEVVNKQGEMIEEAEIIIEESNKREFSGVTDKTGSIITVTKQQKVYELYVRKFGQTYKYEVILPQDKTLTEYKYTAVVDFSKKPKRKFRLNAYFDTGKWDLRQESFPDLEKLLKFMQENEIMVIEVEGHTDSRDTEKRNQVLSENRARSIKVWLTDKGIDGKRISYVGYGEGMPCATNKTEEGRQLNRRIEVSVLDE